MDGNVTHMAQSSLRILTVVTVIGLILSTGTCVATTNLASSSTPTTNSAFGLTTVAPYVSPNPVTDGTTFSMIGSINPNTSRMETGVNVWSLDQKSTSLLKQANITWIRAVVVFNSRFQNTYALASKHGLSIIGQLNDETFNDNASFTLNDWTKTVTKAKDQFPLIRIWEIWNEPTLSKYQLGYMDGSPDHYLDLLKSAYQILKTANPKNELIGLGGTQIGIAKDLIFSDAVFSKGGAAFMDGISVHAYPEYPVPGQSWDYYQQVWNRDLQQLSKFQKPVWVTETGVESNRNGSTEASQATFLKNDYQFFQQHGAYAFIWFQISDYYESDNSIATFGLMRTDGSLKPAFYTYSSLLTNS